MWWHLVQSSTTPLPFCRICFLPSPLLLSLAVLHHHGVELLALPLFPLLFLVDSSVFQVLFAEAKLNKTCVVLSKSDSRADHLQGVGHGCVPSSPSLSCCFIAKNILFLLFLSYFLICIYCCKAGFYTSVRFLLCSSRSVLILDLQKNLKKLKKFFLKKKKESNIDVKRKGVITGGTYFEIVILMPVLQKSNDIAPGKCQVANCS